MTYPRKFANRPPWPTKSSMRRPVRPDSPSPSNSAWLARRCQPLAPVCPTLLIWTTLDSTVSPNRFAGQAAMASGILFVPTRSGVHGRDEWFFSAPPRQKIGIDTRHPLSGQGPRVCGATGLRRGVAWMRLHKRLADDHAGVVSPPIQPARNRVMNRDRGQISHFSCSVKALNRLRGKGRPDASAWMAPPRPGP